MSYTPLLKSIHQKTKEQQQQEASRARQEETYRTEVKLELVKKLPIEKAKEYYDLIKEVEFPEFSFHWRALETFLHNEEVPTKKGIQDIVDFLHTD